MDSVEKLTKYMQMIQSTHAGAKSTVNTDSVVTELYDPNTARRYVVSCSVRAACQDYDIMARRATISLSDMLSNGWPDHVGLVRL